MRVPLRRCFVFLPLSRRLMFKIGLMQFILSISISQVCYWNGSPGTTMPEAAASSFSCGFIWSIVWMACPAVFVRERLSGFNCCCDSYYYYYSRLLNTLFDVFGRLLF